MTDRPTPSVTTTHADSTVQGRAQTAPAPIEERRRAFVAFALGLVGILDGGAVGASVLWVLMPWLEGSGYYLTGVAVNVIPGLVGAGFGVAAWWLAKGARPSDAVAAPAARAAQVLAVVAVLGGLLRVLAAVVEQLWG